MKLFVNCLTASLFLSPSGATHLRRSLSPFNEDCTALIKEKDNGDAPGQTSLACVTPSGLIFDVDSVSADWVRSKAASGALKSGVSRLKVDGAQVDHWRAKIFLAGPPGLVDDPGQALGKNKNRNLAVVTGTKTVLVVRVQAADAVTGFSETALSDSVFGNAGDAVNLKSQYSACSHGQLNFVEAADRAGLSTNILNGAVTVTVPTTTGEGDGVMRNAITNELQSQFGTSVTNLADHIMYCLPTGTMNGIAYAYINSWNSVYSNEWCTYMSGQMHELGHNLNLAHSGENGNTYEDQSGMMGYSYSQDDGPRMCFNPAKSWYLNWYSNRQQTVDVNNPYSGALLGIVDYDDTTSGPPVLIKLQQQSGENYYVTFNSQSSFNSGTQEGGNRVTIVQKTGSGYAASSLVAKLAAGGSYTVSDFSGSGQDMVVSVSAINISTRTATVSIDVLASPTQAPVTQSPTKSPTFQPTAAPSTSVPTPSPSTPLPTMQPTSAPTDSPSTATPTTYPSTPAPTTLAPTIAPTTSQPTKTPFACGKKKDACVVNADCCSNNCGGKPGSRVCKGS